MRNVTFIAALTLATAGFGGIVGCDDTIESDREVKVKDDGTKVTKEEKTVEKADGTIEKTEEKTVDKPGN
jgi:hypothetical protein